MLARPVLQCLHTVAVSGTATVVARGCKPTRPLSGENNDATKPLQVTVPHARGDLQVLVYRPVQVVLRTVPCRESRRGIYSHSRKFRTDHGKCGSCP